MALLGRTALINQLDTLHASAQPGGITAAQTRTLLLDIIDSFDPQGADMNLISDVQNVSITGTPTKFATNYQANTSENPIFVPDPGNGRIRVKKACFCLVTFRMVGEWNAGEDLVVELYANGAPHPFSPKYIAQEGQGGNDPVAISFSGLGFPVLTSMLSGGFCDIEVFFSSLTGTFSLDVERLELAANYVALTADEL